MGLLDYKYHRNDMISLVFLFYVCVSKKLDKDNIKELLFSDFGYQLDIDIESRMVPQFKEYKNQHFHITFHMTQVYTLKGMVKKV